MIIFLNGLGQIIVASTEYGDQGRKELESIYKKLNVKKDVYRDLGSPCYEKLIIAESKVNSLIQNGAKIVSPVEMAAVLKAKSDTWQRHMANLASKTTGKPPTTYTNAFDGEVEEPIRYNKRDNDRKTSHKERIRQERRNNRKRMLPDEREPDDGE